MTSGGLLGVWGKWMKHAKYIYNIQDFNPEQVLAVGYTKSKFITDAMMWFDKFSCKRSDLVITVGRDLVETVEKRFEGKKVPKTVMINNWIDENEIYPLDENNEKVLTGSNVTVIPYSTLHTQDYVAAADYVVTKAGWGTVAECLLAQKPMALFARDSVLENRTTIRLLEQKKLAIKVTYEQLTEMSDLLEQIKRITYPAVPEYHNAAAEIVSKLLTLTE